MIEVWNEPDNPACLAYEIVHELCWPILAEPFQRDFSAVGKIQLPPKLYKGHFHVLTMHPLDGVQAWEADATPPDRRPFSVWGTRHFKPAGAASWPLQCGFQAGKDVNFVGTWEIEMNWNLGTQAVPQAKAIHESVPVDFADVVYYRPEVGSVPGSGQGFAQLSIWANTVPGHEIKATVKGGSRDVEKDIVHDGLWLPIFSDRVGGNRKLVHLTGYRAAINFMIEGFRLRY